MKTIIFAACVWLYWLCGDLQAQYLYVTNNDAITITLYYGPGGTVTIPSSINGYPVTSIGYEAFYGDATVTNLMIPNSVTSIGTAAFYFCSGLTNLNLPASVVAIGDGAFYGCSTLPAINVDPANPAYSSVSGVLFNKSQTTLVAYPNARPGSYSIPAGVTNCVVDAFAGCLYLTSVTIPTSVLDVGMGPFFYCPALSQVTVNAPNAAYASSAGVLFDQNQKTVLRYPPANTATSYTIPGGVSAIGLGAFEYSEYLKSITIPNSVTNIGVRSFEECFDLIGVTIPASVTLIDYGAFQACYKLNGVYFQGDMPVMGQNVFNDTPAFTVYYPFGFTTWNATFQGRTAVLSYPNLVANGNFETGNFSGWSVSTVGSFNYLVVTNAHSGFYAAELQKQSGTLAAITLAQTLPTIAGGYYLISLWVNGISNGGLLVDWNGVTLVNASFPSGWTHLQYIVSATAATTTLKLVTAYDDTSVDDVSVVALPDFDRLTPFNLGPAGVRLHFQGNASANYILDRTFNLSPPIAWTPLATNATDANGVWLMTNAPVTTTNNFWRLRSTP